MLIANNKHCCFIFRARLMLNILFCLKLCFKMASILIESMNPLNAVLFRIKYCPIMCWLITIKKYVQFLQLWKIPTKEIYQNAVSNQKSPYLWFASIAICTVPIVFWPMVPSHNESSSLNCIKYLRLLKCTCAVHVTFDLRCYFSYGISL